MKAEEIHEESFIGAEAQQRKGPINVVKPPHKPAYRVIQSYHTQRSRQASGTLIASRSEAQYLPHAFLREFVTTRRKSQKHSGVRMRYNTTERRAQQ